MCKELLLWNHTNHWIKIKSQTLFSHHRYVECRRSHGDFSCGEIIPDLLNVNDLSGELTVRTSWNFSILFVLLSGHKPVIHYFQIPKLNPVKQCTGIYSMLDQDWAFNIQSLVRKCSILLPSVETGNKIQLTSLIFPSQESRHCNKLKSVF